MLDSIETNYNKKLINCTFYNWDAQIHYPTRLMFDNNDSILIDMLSGLKYIKTIKIEQDQLDELRASTPTKVLNDLEYEIIKNLSLKVEVAKNIPGADDISENILNPGIFYSIAYIYKDLLDNFYNMQYLLTHYVRVSWDSLLEMTPVETTILYKNFIEDKERQNEKNKKGGSLNISDPNVADTLNPY